MSKRKRGARSVGFSKRNPPSVEQAPDLALPLELFALKRTGATRGGRTPPRSQCGAVPEGFEAFAPGPALFTPPTRRSRQTLSAPWHQGANPHHVG